MNDSSSTQLDLERAQARAQARVQFLARSTQALIKLNGKDYQKLSYNLAKQSWFRSIENVLMPYRLEA